MSEPLFTRSKTIAIVYIIFVVSAVFAVLSPFTVPSSPKTFYYDPPPFISSTGRYWVNLTFVGALGENYTTLDLGFFPVGQIQVPTIVPRVRSTVLGELGSPTFYYTYFYNASCLYFSYIDQKGVASQFNLSNIKEPVCGSIGLAYTPPRQPSPRYQFIESTGIPTFMDGGYWAVSTESPHASLLAWSWWLGASDLVIAYNNGDNVSLKNVGFVINMTTINMTTKYAPNRWILMPYVAVSGGSITVFNETTGVTLIVHTGILLPLYSFRYVSVVVNGLSTITVTALILAASRRRTTLPPPGG
jgi:hypothetical protein